MPPSQRTAIVDILRGWSLLGVVLVNYALFYYLDRNVRVPADDIPSQVSKLLVQVFFQAKGWTLLAVLFGYGFSMLASRLEQSGTNVPWRFSRRMFWLFVIAVFNCALYYGDVLKDYALVGMVILLVRRFDGRACLMAAAACLLLFPALVAWSHGAGLESPVPAPAVALYQSGHLADVLRFGLLSGLRMSSSASKYFDWDLVMLACALAGAYLHRSGLLLDAAANRTRLGWITLGGLAFAILTAAARAVDASLGLGIAAHYDISLWPMLGQMTCFAAGICWLHARGLATRFLEAFRPVGRMTLTNYVLQNAIGLLLFSGVGLHLLYRVSYAVHVALGLSVFVAQVVFSRWWLATHDMGPLEHLWRWLSAGAGRPGRTRAQSAPAAADG